MGNDDKQSIVFPELTHIQLLFDISIPEDSTQFRCAMPAATASGADANANGSARSREHKQGNQDKEVKEEHRREILRIRKCNPLAFYDILNLEAVKTTCTDTDIKKAYRKISLLTHPDKNGHEHADECFKMVSRAFGILGDKEKRAQFDRHGGDPDSRFGGGGFDNGPGFVFNMGGGPGIRVHQFGGARPRRRPRDPNAPEPPPASLQQTLMGLLPLLFILIL